MNGAQRRKSKYKRLSWGFRLSLSLVVLLTLALIGVIIWLLKTQDLDKLSTKLGILASIVTALIGLPTLFFTIVKWPDSDSPKEQASSLASPGGIHADTITNTTNVVSGMQYIGTQINYGPAIPSSSRQAPADQLSTLDSSSSLWTVLYPRNSLFTGREDLLARLAQALQPGQAMALSQAHAISGLGGIGKTQLAIEYAYQHRQDYQAVFWVRADTRENLVADFVSMASKLQLPERKARDVQQTVTAVQGWLHTQSGWLLILDNADDLALAGEFLPPSYGGQVLLTTRAQAMGRLAQRIEVDIMPQEVGALFLLRRAGLLAPDAQLDQASAQDREQAEELVRELGGLPLALDQAGAYMEETPCGIAEYLRLYRSRRALLLKRRGGLVKDHPASVATTWSLSFAAVEQTNPAAADLLRVCAFLHPDVIPEELLRQGLAKLEPPLQALGTDELAFHEAVRTLGAYSLLRRDRTSQTLSIHRLVQAVLIDTLALERLQAWVERTTHLLSATSPESGAVTFPHWEAWERLLPHALTWAAHLQQAQFASSEGAKLLRLIGWYLKERGQYAEAEPLLQRTLAIYRQQLGEEHQDTSVALVTLGWLYEAQGRYAEAEPLFKHALVIVEKTVGPEHLSTAATLTNLANLYRVQGRYEEAEPFLLRALAIYEKALGPDHPATATALTNLGLLYKVQGRYAEAEPLYQRDLAICEKELGPDHPDTAIALNNLAALYETQGRYKEAEPLYQRALAINEQALPPDHPETAITLNNLAVLYQAQGRYTEAESLYQRSLAIKEKALPPDHPDTAIALANYASLLRRMQRSSEAISLEQRARTIRAKQQPS